MIKGVKFQLEDLRNSEKKEVKYHFKELIESKANAFNQFIFDFTLFASEICFSGEYDVEIDWENIVMKKFSDDVKNIAHLGFWVKDTKLSPFICSNFEFI